MKSRSRAFAICLVAVCLMGGLAASSAAGAATPAWAPISASGPTNLPPVQSEVQRITVDAEGGSFKLTANHASARGSGSLTAGATNMTSFVVETGGFSVGQTVTGDFIQPETTISSCTPNCSSPTRVTLSKKSTNISTVTEAKLFAVEASATTASLPFSADASAVEAALNGLSTIGGLSPTPGSVTVTGGPGDKGASHPYFVSYGGALANTNLPPLEVNGAGLTGGFNHEAKLLTTLDGGPGTSTIMFYAQNLGGVPSSGAVTLKFTLPPGVKTTATPEGGKKEFSFPNWECSPTGAGQTEVTCVTGATANPTAAPGFTLPPVKAPVTAEAGAQSGIVHMEVSGGGAVGTATYDMPLVVSAIPAPPGLQAFTAGAYNDDGTIDTRAGGHPYSASSGILNNTVRSAKTGQIVPAGEFRDILVDTPPGFLGNPIAPEQCPESFTQEDCSPPSLVATAQIPLQILTGTEAQELSSVENLEAPYGHPGRFRFRTGLGTVSVNVAANLRSDEDYGLQVGSVATPQIRPVFGAFFTFWANTGGIRPRLRALR